MSLTQGAGLYVGVNDRFFPKVVTLIGQQRPSLLNYATPYFRANPSRVCVPVPRPANGAPVFTALEPIQLGLGTGVPGVELVLQVTGIGVGFGVDNIGLPPMLRPLPPERIAAKISFTARLAVPQLDPSSLHCPEDGGASQVKYNLNLCDCFSGDLCAIVEASLRGCRDAVFLTYAFDKFDTDNVVPAGLRQAVDNIIVLAINSILLPKLWLPISPVTIDLKKALPAGSPVTSITITPQLPAMQPNPNIANDLLETRLDLKVTAP
jgi:hypothetical protein